MEDKEMQSFDKEVKDMFKLFDKNGDNSITVDEMSKVLKSLGFQMTSREVREAVRSIDSNKNGKIEFSEFRTFMLKQYRQSMNEDESQREIRQAFRLFDRDGNGYIEKGELRRAMRTLGESLSEPELEMMMKEADKNHDGKIDYDEFVKLWTSKAHDAAVMKKT